ncbi:hypothetical protein TRAPUB_6379 [Trametes pubescens]|uniref:RlpA-like protein double-psi beta-barrel domain-containing protein n=1 Tax=Trametes pubescens TaxID=154538 RepID=A0A1M2V6D1_TRAPU|nr:hypothetical protein TRAPUB_6379 [Trametes pubescens]
MFFSKTLVVLSVALSALASPHAARGIHHRDVAHRAAMPIAQPEPVVAPIRKRADSKRCKVRSSTAASSTAAATTSLVAPLNVESSAAPATTATPTTEAAPTTTKAAETTTQAAPTTTKAATTTKHTTTQAAATTSAASSSGGSDVANFLAGTNVGQATFYATGLTACGITNKDTDYIAAVSHLLFDTYPGYNGVNPNSNPLCNRKVKATYQGKSVTVAITDRCTGCALTDLDFSPSAFDQLASEDLGRLSGMTWVWAD